MCGFAGYWGGVGSADRAEKILGDMATAVRHRGPDDCGVWWDERADLGLAHRRLSILDLSAEGHQPMRSATGRYVIAYNGEVYNFAELRAALVEERKAPPFRGHSDTEVMLAAVEAWGVRAAVQRMVGMFAFALWDRQERVLHLVRDRLGIKPLYYGWSGGAFLFGSELKTLRAHPAFAAEIDRGSLALLLRHNYIPGPSTIYRGIRKLQPGTILTLRAPDQEAAPSAFWSAREVAEAGVASQLRGSDAELIDGLHDRVAEAVRLRMIADVPLGAFLSGGIDSSTVVALMQAQSMGPVKTFSIGFRDQGFDEAAHARAVAGHLGTDHTELYVTPDDALQVIPRLPEMYDEPFADSSQIPTFLVSRLAREHVTVSLSGDGGDELFAGYNRYSWGRRLWGGLGWIPRPVRRFGGRALTMVSPESWEGIFATLGPVLPRQMRVRMPGNKIHKLAGVIDAEGPDAMFFRLTSLWQHPSAVVRDAVEPPTAISDRSRWASLPSLTERMMYVDLVSYLPDDILTKVDRASMAVGLEARVPLLDHRLVEYAWRLPMSLKLRDGKTKWALRQVLFRYVPPELIERPKMGFGVPVGSWLREPLRAWAEELLSEGRLREEGFFDPAPVRAVWREHLSGSADREYLLWPVLMFQAWLAEN
jgi:asparagine synthase (glutamine-hydrolysing)